jgi:dTDP-glucose 4,6-dehydratase
LGATNVKILVTGGAGFIGSNFIQYMLSKYPSYKIVNLDALTYAGNLRNLGSFLEKENHFFIKGNICDVNILQEILSQGIEVIVNFAAESHVDRSIMDAGSFIKTNINGTYQLLKTAREFPIKKFVQISTDEVYGSLEDLESKFTENSPLQPNNPYAASKAGADLLVQSFYHTYQLPTLITRCSNNFGKNQNPEKLIPLMITHALNNKPLPIYGDGLNIRDWIYVEDHCSAIDAVIHLGKVGNIYNIGANNERTNLEVIKVILDVLDKPESLITFIKDRLGHDRRYAIDSSKIEHELGWKPVYNFENKLVETIHWYRDHFKY